jgi:hypothetical protein
MLLEVVSELFVREEKSKYTTTYCVSFSLIILPIRNYSINQRMLFDENYALASTQSLKNKDIPEGGAKGTIVSLLRSSDRL